VICKYNDDISIYVNFNLIPFGMKCNNINFDMKLCAVEYVFFYCVCSQYFEWND